jgi:hypothetical protein
VEVSQGEGPEILLQLVVGRDMQSFLRVSSTAFGLGRHGSKSPVASVCLLSSELSGFFRTLDEDGATPGRNDRESRQDGDFCVSWRSWIIKSAGEPLSGTRLLTVNGTVPGPTTHSGRTNRFEPRNSTRWAAPASACRVLNSSEERCHIALKPTPGLGPYRIAAGSGPFGSTVLLAVPVVPGNFFRGRVRFAIGSEPSGIDGAHSSNSAPGDFYAAPQPSRITAVSDRY